MDNHSIRSVQALIQSIHNGESPKFILFWGHQEPKPGQITKACLSQWYPSPFIVDDEKYLCAEHYMMAEKARLFGDEETRHKILGVEHPGAAKQLGREVRNFDEVIWEKARFEIVITGNIHKFTQNYKLKEFLLNTGDRILVEASPVDRIWGIGIAADHPHCSNPGAWRGLNLLGFALMEVRARLMG